jgi:hypothetical protein
MAERVAGDELNHTSKKAHWSESKFLLIAIPAGVSIFAAILSAVSASSARADADRFAEQRLNREERIKVYERVETQLGSERSHGILIASAYTKLIEDPEVKQNLCDLINSVALEKLNTNGDAARTDTGDLQTLRRIARQTGDCAADLEQALTSPDEAAGGGSGKASANELQQIAQQQAPPGEVLTLNPNPRGWDVDVFSCQGQGAASEGLAREVANRLASYASGNQRIGNEALGRVRLRSASREAQAKMTNGVIGNAVIASADEAAFAQAIVGDLQGAAPAANFRLVGTTHVTRWYVSVFACGGS